MTYLIAIAVGIPEADAYQIAAANQYTDELPGTSPMPFTGDLARDAKFLDGVRIRWLYHFRTSSINGTVKRNSKEANQIIEQAMNRKNDDSTGELIVTRFLLGIGLHAFQDSWSHEGYGPWLGHAIYKDNVFKDNHTPDLPYASKQNIQKAIEMASATYDKLEAFRKEFYPNAKARLTKAEVDNIAKTLMPLKGTEAERRDRWMQEIQKSMKVDALPYMNRKDMAAKDLAIIDSSFVRAATLVRPPGDAGWILKARSKLADWVKKGINTWEGFFDGL